MGEQLRASVRPEAIHSRREKHVAQSDYGYSDEHMTTDHRFRTVHCAYCGETTIVPSTRGPVATYCSPSHRQAAYRERQRAQRAGAPPPPRSVVEEIVRLRTVLARAAEARSWSEARQVLAGVDDDRGGEGR